MKAFYIILSDALGNKLQYLRKRSIVLLTLAMKLLR